jgi:hypothetical protein
MVSISDLCMHLHVKKGHGSETQYYGNIISRVDDLFRNIWLCAFLDLLLLVIHHVLYVNYHILSSFGFILILM